MHVNAPPGPGRLVYAGAGTSGRLAVQDGAELMPTFNWPEDRLVLLMAGGREALMRSVEGAEDEVELAARLFHDAAVATVATGPLAELRAGLARTPNGVEVFGATAQPAPTPTPARRP